MDRVDLIVCVNKVNAIGKDGKLLYHIKPDMTNFKQLTMFNVVVMGRKTFETLPHPLKNRVNIILTRNKDYYIDLDKLTDEYEIYIVHTIEELSDLVDSLFPHKRVYVIGGAEIYKLFLDEDLVENIDLTYVFDDSDGDSYFPNIIPMEWNINKDDIRFDEESNLSYQFITYTKKR